MIKTFQEIYAYREMIYSLVQRDLKGRYKGSVLGFLWTFLNPLLQLMVYTLVFSVILHSDVKDYYLFLFVALVPWIFFSTSVSGGASCIRAQQGMVTKIYFPREVLPISFVTSQFVNMLLTFLVVFAVLIISGHGINGFAMLFLPIIMIIEYFLALGITMIISALTVYVRDLEWLMGILTMMWQFVTPVMYKIDNVPAQFQTIFYLNPMTSIIVAYRDILYYGQRPHIHTLAIAVIEGIALMFFGFLIFGKLKRHFAEEM